MATQKIDRNMLNTGIVDNSNATAITIDSSENVGIGTNSFTTNNVIKELVVKSTVTNGVSSYTLTTTDNALGGGMRLTSFNDTNALVFGMQTSYNETDTSPPTERMRIDSSGRVGIGTTATDGMLTIKKTGSNIFGDSAVTIQSADTNQSTLALGLTGSVAYIDSTESGSGTVLPLVFATGSTEKMRIDSSGKVGIGTTSPDDMLDVENGNIRLRSNSDGNTGLLRMFDAAGTESGQIYTASGDLKIYSPNDVLFAQTGNVGIGTTSPSAPLTIQSDGTAKAIRLVGRANGSNDESVISFMDNNGSTINCEIISIAKDLTFYTNSAERMRITASGNVGIGSSSPSAFKLLLEGTDSQEGLMIHAGASSSQWLIRAEDNAANQRFVVKSTGDAYFNGGDVGIGFTNAKVKLEVATVNAEMSHFGGINGANGQYTGITLGYREANLNYRKTGIVQEQIGDGAARGHLHLCVDTGADAGSMNPTDDSKLMINGITGQITQPQQTYFSVKRSGNQTFANVAWVDVIWNSEITDIGGNFASNTFTAPTAGVYLFTGLIAFTTVAATNYLLARFVCNTAGDFYITHEQKRSGGGDYGYDSAISEMITLAAGETVKIQVYAASGGDHVLRQDSRWQGRLMG